jgi:hypothetical protein
MRLTLDSTDETGMIEVGGAQIPARFWMGTTEQGNRVAAFITRIAPLDLKAAIELEISLFDVTAQTTTVIDPDWQVMTEPGYEWYRLVMEGQTLWIAPRPKYCIRGRYHANYDGSFHIAGGDGFPRYYMDLEAAKSEMKAWLLHRIECERSQG